MIDVPNRIGYVYPGFQRRKIVIVYGQSEVFNVFSSYSLRERQHVDP